MGCEVEQSIFGCLNVMSVCRSGVANQTICRRPEPIVFLGLPGVTSTLRVKQSIQSGNTWRPLRGYQAGSLRTSLLEAGSPESNALISMEPDEVGFIWSTVILQIEQCKHTGSTSPLPCRACTNAGHPHLSIAKTTFFGSDSRQHSPSPCSNSPNDR